MPLSNDIDIFGQFEELCFRDVGGLTRFQASYYGWKPLPHLQALKYKGTRGGRTVATCHFEALPFP